METPYKYPDQIWLLGDSITQFSFSANGIGARLAGAYRCLVMQLLKVNRWSKYCPSDVYARKLDVINRGYSGYNARWDSIVWEQILPTREQREAQHLPNIRLLTIWLGTNDSTASGSVQHVSLEDFHANISKIISLTRERSPETRIVLIAPGPVQPNRAEKNFYLNQTPPRKMDRSNEQVKQYVDATEQIGKKEGVPVVNTWDAVWAAAGSRDEAALESLYSDGLHLAAPGYKVGIIS
jgi:lysophospholipase L1-like esterase